MMAVTAFSGATSASAAAIDVCLNSSGFNLTAADCKSNGGTIDTEESVVVYTASATNPIFKGSLEEECGLSTATIKSDGNGTPGTALLSLAFSGSCAPCPTVDTNPPYDGKLVMEGEDYYLKVPTSVTLLGCFGFVNCSFSSEAVTLKYVSGAGHTNNQFRAEAEKLTGPGGLCGTSVTWTANYTVSLPSKWFFFLL